MLDAAADGGYAYAAHQRHLLRDAERRAAGIQACQCGWNRPDQWDGIVQISVGGAEYMSGTAVKEALRGARAFARYAHLVAEASPVLVALHTDHCPRAHVDLGWRPVLAEPSGASNSAPPPAPLPHVRRLEASARREPADCVRPARQCSELDVILEVKSGVAGGEEDGIVAPRTGATSCTPRLPTSSAWPTR